MSPFKWRLLGAGMLAASLLSFAQDPAFAQTRTAELDRIQAPAQALPKPEQRVALVIGNSNYRSVAPLPNPDGDAQSVAEFLNSAGFEVIAATDVTQNDMIRVVQDFSDKISERGPDTVAMIYYAGHGVQVAGENYLIPVDARIATPIDLANNAVRLVDLMATLESIPSRLRIVMLDSCRNNPFPNIDDAGRGLALVDAPTRSIVGYSTAPGAPALDGADGSHSPYAQAFLKIAREPNLPIEQLFKRIRLEVNHATEGLQTPWDNSTVTSDFYFFGDTAVAASRAPEHGPVVHIASNLPWESVNQVYDYVLSEGSPAFYQEFIDRFPYDPRCDHIRHLLVNLAQAAAWHQAVLANSPVAYKSFFDRHADSPYAKAALHLQSDPKAVALMQASRLYKGGPGIRQTPFSGTAKIRMLPAHGLNAPTNGKVVNLPVGNKASNVAPIDHNSKPVEHKAKPAEADVKASGNSPGKHDETKFERRQSTFNRFNNSQAHAGNGMYMGSGMRMDSGMRRMSGGGMHFGGGRGYRYY
jgi:caspase domain-containing protein